MTEPYFTKLDPSINEISESLFNFNLFPLAMKLQSIVKSQLTIKRKELD